MLKNWKRIILLIIGLTMFLFATLMGVLYWKQDEITRELLTTINKDFTGEVIVKDTHISPFVNFPYISIDLDSLIIFEDKTRSTVPVLSVRDVYIGFDLWSVVRGRPDVKMIKLLDGQIKIIQHINGEYNLAKALSTTKEIEDAGEEFHMHLRSIELQNIDILKIRESDSLIVESWIDEARAGFESTPDHILAYLKSTFLVNVMVGKDTTFIKHKHFAIDTRIDFDNKTQIVKILPSDVRLENGIFGMEGSVDLDQDADMNLKFHGNKSNFDLLMAFAPEELMPVLKRYENEGKIFFEASVTGKSVNGHRPLIVADFGCEQAFFNNTISNRKLEDLFFKGHFSNGEKRDASTMEFSLLDVSARPEAGLFEGYLKVKNFESPEIDMQIRSDLDLEFLAAFLNVDQLQNLRGSISLEMNFHDIVDLQNPEKSIEKLNESYYTKLHVKNLSFQTPSFHLPVDNLTIAAHMDGHEAFIDTLQLKLGKSDLFIRAKISDFPALLHHTSEEVTADMQISSTLMDILELTSGDTSTRKPVNEQLENVSLKVKFKSSARAFTESPHLPAGEFFIEDLYARMKNYPHTLHDFHADVFVDEQDFRIVDFTGVIDKSDFHFSGKLKRYDLWFAEEMQGDTQITFDLTSNLLQLQDIFSYGGENFVPQDYRHEEFREVKVKGHADLHFKKTLQSSDFYLDNLEGKMKIHPLKLEKFKGHVHWGDDHLVVNQLSGTMGESSFTAKLNYYLGSDSSLQKRDNYFSFEAPRLNFDELFNYTPPPTSGKIDHEAGFNIYTLPFTNMKFDVTIGSLNYHRFQIDQFHASVRSTPRHYLFVDTLSMKAAGGQINLKGYFNGSDPSRIYFSPVMQVQNVDLDKLLIKFDNFGQDHLVSENLHGQISGNITGKVRMHPDLVPILDDSELHLDVKVTDGRLEHYSALEALSDYFGDKNLKKVLFDTLRNQIDLSGGNMTIPAMTINSSLGFIEVEGQQNMNTQMMEYYVRVPWKLVTQAGAQKLFGKKSEEVDPDQVDAIEYRNTEKNVRFLHVKISGSTSDFKISLGKNRKKKP